MAMAIWSALSDSEYRSGTAMEIMPEIALSPLKETPRASWAVLMASNSSRTMGMNVNASHIVVDRSRAKVLPKTTNIFSKASAISASPVVLVIAEPATYNIRILADDSTAGSIPCSSACNTAMTTMNGSAGISILQRRMGLALKIRSDARSAGAMAASQYAGIMTVVTLNAASQASLYEAFMCPP